MDLPTRLHLASILQTLGEWREMERNTKLTSQVRAQYAQATATLLAALIEREGYDIEVPDTVFDESSEIPEQPQYEAPPFADGEGIR